MPRLSNDERMRALGMVDAGVKYSEIARFFNCAKSTIGRLVQRHRQTGSVRDRARPGRERCTTPIQDNQIRLTHLRDRFRPATKTAQDTPGTHNPRISSSTVRRRLRVFGIKAHRPVRGAILTRVRRQARLTWTRQHRNWIQRQWNSVLFSDESRFCLNKADGRDRAYRRQGERYADCCVREVDRWEGNGVMVWGGISFRHKTQIVFIDGYLTADDYINDVLDSHVVPFYAQHPDVTMFQHDNARPHSANITQEYLHAEGIDVLPWPSFSPDLNPIEHLWDQMKRRIRNRDNAPSNRIQLVQAIQEEWDNIPQRQIQNLIRSMNRRCEACITARGGHIRY